MGNEGSIMKNGDVDPLVVLCWASNTCYTTVCRVSDVSGRKAHDPEDGDWTWAEMEIDFDKQTWKHGKKNGKIGTHFTDPCRIWSDSQYGVIGVYDPSDIKQLSYMVRHAQEAVSDRNRGGWD